MRWSLVFEVPSCFVLAEMVFQHVFFSFFHTSSRQIFGVLWKVQKKVSSNIRINNLLKDR